MTATANEERHQAGLRRAELAIAAGFWTATAAFVALAVVYWRGGQPQAEGVLLAIGFGGLAWGIVATAKRFMPQGPAEQERHRLASGEPEREAVEASFERAETVERRKLLLGSLGAAGTALIGAAVFPLRSLGPSPGDSLAHSPWRAGTRLVTEDGRPILAADVPDNGLVTVFPEGLPGSADGQAVLISVPPGLLRPKAGREAWSPRGLVAYSKVCTHAGCPVGLYQSQTHQLLCPCHQSTFDVLDAAQPVFGPAAAPLPQLPLMIDDEGYLRATGDFSAPVGPAYWNLR